MAKLTFPPSPTPGQEFEASNGIIYTWDNTIGPGAWLARIPFPLNVDYAGEISGSPFTGEVLTYSTGTATGGTPPYAYSWVWKVVSSGLLLQTGGNTYTIPGNLVDERIVVEFTVTDSLSNTNTKSTSFFPAGSSIAPGPFPNSFFGPVGAPNAAPASINVDPYFGTATCFPWGDGPKDLTSTGGLLFNLNGSAYGVGPTSVDNGDTITLVWDTAVIAAAADGETLVGTLTDGEYLNTFSITIGRSPDNLNGGFSALADQALITTLTSNIVTPSGFNVPITLSISGSGPDPLTSIGASVDGGAFVSGDQTVILGQQISLQGTTGAANSTTYAMLVTLGSGPAASEVWTVETAGGVAAIAQPSITAPANGATGINPAAGGGLVTITGSTYTPLNGAPAQVSSLWELYRNGPGPTFQSTNTISSVTPYVPPIGSVYRGGYFGGQISTPGNGVADYNLIVAPNIGDNSGPNPAGALTGYGFQRIYNKTLTEQYPPYDPIFNNGLYGKPATDAYGGNPKYQAFYWCKNDPGGPCGSGGIGGYTDWYIPALYELQPLFFFLKPDTNTNNTSYGATPYAVAPQPYNQNWQTTYPGQTTVAAFQNQNDESFYSNPRGYIGSASGFWSATGNNGWNFWTTNFTGGNWFSGAAQSNNRVRAIRRSATNGAGSDQVLYINGLDLDGISTGAYVRGSSSGATGFIIGLNGTLAIVTQTSGNAFVAGERLVGDGVAVTGSPFTIASAPFERVEVAQSAFNVSSRYYTRTQYASALVTSEYSPWSSFTTAASFV